MIENSGPVHILKQRLRSCEEAAASARKSMVESERAAAKSDAEADTFRTAIAKLERDDE